MSDIIAGVSLSILDFPDITSSTTKFWLSVALGYGLNYTTGGIPFGLIALADSKTVNFDGFLRCDVFDEAVAGSTFYTFRYVPATDSLQIFQTNSAGATTELANGAVLPTALLTDSSIVAEATFNRTEMLG
jgi:hypothetical protein